MPKHTVPTIIQLMQSFAMIMNKNTSIKTKYLLGAKRILETKSSDLIRDQNMAIRSHYVYVITCILQF